MTFYQNRMVVGDEQSVCKATHGEVSLEEDNRFHSVFVTRMRLHDVTSLQVTETDVFQLAIANNGHETALCVHTSTIRIVVDLLHLSS